MADSRPFPSPESCHTPGPWKVTTGAANTLCVQSLAGAREYPMLAVMMGDCDAPSATVEETRANARLMALAPEMLEALRNGVACSDCEDWDAVSAWAEEANTLVRRARPEDPQP